MAIVSSMEMEERLANSKDDHSLTSLWWKLVELCNATAPFGIFPRLGSFLDLLDGKIVPDAGEGIIGQENENEKQSRRVIDSTDPVPVSLSSTIPSRDSQDFRVFFTGLLMYFGAN
ncbi:hypothetical protein N7520_009222 [Penicillium odoratum]|uniref:uncharacterized protein n=1 Tax=Penicillium odoratum TaxID=1167516 RepID=UPI00254854CE|nr:uncharacterized protein N7520_009222 [Penicillium odoratum]KAJ5752305.1 hypothetical protein N7520_009222 [Penicillium odoratum]